jgi:hypothetical protein
LFTDANTLIAISFFWVLDDWILYHVQAPKLGSYKNSFVLGLGLDLLVLGIWFCAALQATVGIVGIGMYLIILSCFYAATACWEIVFLRHTQSSIRLICDLYSFVILVILALILNQKVITKDQFWVIGLLFLVFISRIPAWWVLIYKQRNTCPTKAST